MPNLSSSKSISKSSIGSRMNCYVKIIIYVTLIAIFSNENGSVSCLEKVCGEFISGRDRNTKGVFKYDASTLKESLGEDESFICLYKFVSKKNEKVLIKFNQFNVKSVAPDCINEYLDIYIEVTEDKIDSYVETNFLSRWCGWKKPEILISFDNVIIIAYHRDWMDRGSNFYGTYEFVDAAPYNVGKLPEKACEYEFKSDTSKSGVVTSPTYPGTYPNILNCKYKFYGLPTERVLIYFEEILIHHEADHCPYDAIRVFDFQKVSSSTSRKKITALNRILIDTFCGSKSNFQIYSTNNLFEIEFEMADSLSNDQYSDLENQILLRKGFRLRYEFSDKYADLSFITGQHITGTNCDQRIRSKEQTGIIYSPNYFRTIPANVTCKYIFQGLDDHYNFESIRLNFLESTLKPATTQDICNEKRVSYFTVYDSNKEKEFRRSKYCFVHLGKNDLRSIDSEMIIEFKSQHANEFKRVSKFKANFTFYSEFGIKGTRVYQNRTCLYTYNSNGMAHGVVNSPRYPNNYPLNLMCIYLFNIKPDERILFTFNEFRFPNWNDECNPYEDSLSIHQTDSQDLKSATIDSMSPQIYSPHHLKKKWQLVSRHCGIKIPLPFITSPNQKQVKFTFFSDNVNYAQGFEFNYDYVKLPECEYHYYTTHNKTAGQITISNNIKSIYYCNWYITTESDKTILLFIKNENLNDYKRNQFVIRIFDLGRLDVNKQYTEQIENRNDQVNPRYTYHLDQSSKNYDINSSRIRIQLVLGKNMVMDEGKLTINWVATNKDLCKKDEFMCQKDGYCIKRELYCDKIVHCLDGSDEREECVLVKREKTYFPFIEILSVIGALVIIIILLSFCVHCRLHSQKKTKLKNANINGPPIFYRYSPAESVDYLEAAITSV